MGATAIGTGINAHPGYAEVVCRRLRESPASIGHPATNLIEATQGRRRSCSSRACMKRVAIKLSKICNDLRLLVGTARGLNEINLPPMQPGSSIMPGKVNPVIPEVVNQIAFDVIGSE